jgi:TRAP-type C4-dicarboxylate transport system substrate-binding protein
MPPDIQQAFMAAAQEAADQGNRIDRDGERSFKQKLREAKMEIYTPSAAEKAQWQKIGEAVWETQGKEIDAAVIRSMIALR